MAKARPKPRVGEAASAWQSSPSGACLLDVNVLIALIEPMHTHHVQAHDWFFRGPDAAWATCPITENGVLRIVGNARYPMGPGSPAKVIELLAPLRALPGHRFWPDDVSLLDATRIDSRRVLSHEQITDSYLLALAVAHGGRLATFDRRLVADAVIGGRAAVELIR